MRWRGVKATEHRRAEATLDDLRIADLGGHVGLEPDDLTMTETLREWRRPSQQAIRRGEEVSEAPRADAPFDNPAVREPLASRSPTNSP